MTIFNLLHLRMSAWLLILFVALLPLFAFAGGGDDHSHGPEAKALVGAPATTGQRLELKSPEVELLGVLQDGKLTVYADRYATNEPILDAKIELESSGRKVQVLAAKDGSYSAEADWLAQPGKHEVVVSIQAKGLEDLLIGTLEVPSLTNAAHGRTWLAYAKWLAGGSAALIALLLLFKLLRRRKGAAAALMLPVFVAVLLSGHSAPGFAHGDEDHSEKPKTAPTAAAPSAASATLASSGAAPVRLPDGSIFAPKPVQRLLGIRTILGESGDIAKTVTLNGRIIADPNFSGRVQSSQAGRMAAPIGGFPALGATVRKGQILAYIEPAASSIEKGNQQAQLAELTSNLVLAEHRAQRLEQLVGSLPQKEIDAARAEAVSLKARKAAVAGSLFQREALQAPVAGVISQANVVTGQVVEAKEILFEVIDPAKLRVEAIAYDNALSGQVAAASGATATRQSLSLSFIGQGYQLREQTLPMLFTINPPAPLVSVGQAVEVFIQSRQTIRSIRVPQSSVVKSNNGEAIVWVHTSAERFVSQRVQVQALDASSVAIVAGLQDGDRVVTQGASLLSQIR